MSSRIFHPRARSFLELFNQPIAHRGLWGEGAAENSLEAVAAAVDAGLPLELDVQLTADFQPVIYHDWTTTRLSPPEASLPQFVSDVKLPDLKAAGLVGGCVVPALKEALEVIDGRVPLLLELKQPGKPGRLELAVLSSLCQYPGPVAIQSFNPFSVRWFAKHNPDRLRGVISSRFRDGELTLVKRTLASSQLLTPAARPDFLSFNLEDLPHLPTEALSRVFRIPVVGWTLTDPSLKWGHLVSQVIFEGFRPAVG